MGAATAITARSTTIALSSEVCADGRCVEGGGGDNGSTNQSTNDGSNGSSNQSTNDGSNGSSNQTSNQSANGSSNQTTNQNNGENSACEGSVPCNTGVEALEEDGYYNFRPGDSTDSNDRHGCEVSAEDGEILVVEASSPVEAQSCPGDNRHRYVVPFYTCAERGLTITMTVEAKDDQCPIDDWFEDLKAEVAGVDQECGGDVHTACYNYSENDGVYTWEGIMDQETHLSSRRLTQMILDLEPRPGSSVPYEVSVEVGEY